jgi:hypothetical protein
MKNGARSSYLCVVAAWRALEANAAEQRVSRNSDSRESSGGAAPREG